MNSDVVLVLTAFGLFIGTGTILSIRTIAYDIKQRKRAGWYKRKIETGSFMKEAMDVFVEGERHCLVSKKEMKIIKKSVPMYIQTNGATVAIKMPPHSDLKISKDKEKINIVQAGILDEKIKMYHPVLEELYDKVLHTYHKIYGDNSKQIKALIHSVKITYHKMTPLYKVHNLNEGPFSLHLLKYKNGERVVLSLKEQEIWTYERLNRENTTTENEELNDYLLEEQEKQALKQLTMVVKSLMENRKDAKYDTVLERIQEIDEASDEKHSLQQSYQELHIDTKNKIKADLHEMLNVVEKKLYMHE